MLRGLLNVPGHKEKSLVLDNARFHHAIINRKFLKSVKDEIVLMYLPAYSPELNPIESFWKKTRRAVTHNRYYESLGRRENALNHFFNKFKNQNDVLTSLSVKY